MHSPLTTVTRVRYPASACEMVMWSPSQTGGFPPGTQVSSHMKTIRTQTSVPMSMINISCITCFIIVNLILKYVQCFFTTNLQHLGSFSENATLTKFEGNQHLVYKVLHITIYIYLIHLNQFPFQAYVYSCQIYEIQYGHTLQGVNIVEVYMSC